MNEPIALIVEAFELLQAHADDDEVRFWLKYAKSPEHVARVVGRPVGITAHGGVRGRLQEIT